MIGIVVVSHSARLAEGVCELAAQMGRDQVRLAPAGGTADPQNPIGTDAFKVLAAIESVYSEDGVLVFVDLGSAVLSAETALEFLDEAKRLHVRLSPAPVVQGAVAAAAQASAGASLDEILRPTPAQSPKTKAAEHREVTVANPLGLHARPAARLIHIARRFQSRVTIENLTNPVGPSDAASLNALLGLAARAGHQLRLRAEGPDAGDALAAIAADIESRDLSGAVASAGIAIGPLARLHPAAIPHDNTTIDDPAAEHQRLLAAVLEARDETRALYDWARAHAGLHEAAIFDAQALLLEDAALLDAASRLVLEQRSNAAFAWQEAARTHSHAADVADVSARVLRRLTGLAPVATQLTQPAILTAHDLTPSQVRDLDPEFVLGVCLETGSAAAHSTILARAIGIPVVTGLGATLAAVEEGTIVALDGESGAIWISPDAALTQSLQTRREQWLAHRRDAQSGRYRPAATRDGRRIKVFANISSVAEAAEAVEQGADGVGVLRTEFLFLNRPTAPGEAEQAEAYRAIAGSLEGRPLVIRTLDVGGDKGLPYVDIGEEANPFLGWRGIRVTLGRPDLFHTQLRAILRTAADYPVSLLLPMVSSLEEVRATRAILRDLNAPVDLPLGVMIEVPAAVAIAPELAREASFFSIGSNDLIQYLMAADRTNPRVASLADPLQPAVLRTIRQAVAAARTAGIDATLCGELAADPRATAILIGMDLDEFSVSPPLIPELKRAIADITIPEAQAAAGPLLSPSSEPRP